MQFSFNNFSNNFIDQNIYSFFKISEKKEEKQLIVGNPCECKCER